MEKSSIKQLIRMCFESKLDLRHFIRAYIKELPKTKESGAYKGN